MQNISRSKNFSKFFLIVQHALRAYCPNINTVETYLARCMPEHYSIQSKASLLHDALITLEDRK